MKIKRKHVFIASICILLGVLLLFSTVLLLKNNNVDTGNSNNKTTEENIKIDDTIIFNGLSDKIVIEAINKEEIYEQYSYTDERTQKTCYSYYIHDLSKNPLISEYTNGFLEIVTTNDDNNNPYIQNMRYYYTLTIDENKFHETILKDTTIIADSLIAEKDEQPKRIYYFMHTDENGIYEIPEFNKDMVDELLKKQEMNRLYVMIQDCSMYDIFVTFRVAKGGGYEIIAEYSRKL